MKILSTDDISQAVLEDLRSDLAGEIDAGIDDRRIFFKSLDAPTWIRLVAEAQWWQQAFAAIAALYVAELVKEAAKETWMSRAKVISAFVRGANKLGTLASALVRAKHQTSRRTEIVISFPKPNEYFSTQLTLSAEDAEVVALEIALFIHHLPALCEMIQAQEEAVAPAATGYFLELLPNGDLHVHWFDQQSLRKEEKNFPLRSTKV